jgi:hypothetical protein
MPTKQTAVSQQTEFNFNPLMPNELQRCRAVSHLKIKIPSKKSR